VSGQRPSDVGDRRCAYIWHRLKLLKAQSRNLSEGARTAIAQDVDRPSPETEVLERDL
jgi:hypothetical protein